MKIRTNTQKQTYKSLSLKNLMKSTSVELKGFKRKPKKMKSLKKEAI